MKIYVTFGQEHVHKVNGKTFDNNCVGVLNCEDHTLGRERVFELFGRKFCTTYIEEHEIKYFPRGFMEVE